MKEELKEITTFMLGILIISTIGSVALLIASYALYSVLTNFQ